MEPRQENKPLPPVDLMRQALDWHRAGNLDQAERLYRAVLGMDAHHAGALTNLGTVFLQRGRLAEAVDLIDRSLALVPAQPIALNNRGNALRDLRRNDDALASYAAAIGFRPGFAEAHFNRANLLYAIGRPDEALLGYAHAISINPDYAEAINNRANSLRDLGRGDEALLDCERAAVLKPGSGEVLNTRGTVLSGLGRADEALVSYDRALALEPDYPEALTNRGIALCDLGRHDEALQSYDRAIALKPDHAAAIGARGTLLHQRGQLDEALRCHDRAVALQPRDARAQRNRGDVLRDLNRLDEALECYDRAIVLDPEYAEACNNRGNVLRSLLRLDEALRSYERALALKPDFPWLEGSILHTRMRMCDWADLDSRVARIVAGIERGARVSAPFAILATGVTAELQRQCAQIHARDRYPSVTPALAPPARNPQARIRLGYFSADFRDHPVSYLTAELFQLHDRDRFEVIGISYDPLPEDPVRQRLRGSFDRFVEVADRSDSEIAAIARDMDIDIAVDLGGHTGHSRLGILAHRAAPLQVHFLGYPGTLGAPFIDYLIADPIVVPDAHRPFYAEKIACLPETCQVNDRRSPVAAQAYSRGELGLPDDGFVFCCFNNSYKIEPAVFDVWMRLLRRVEGSVLWLYTDNAQVPGNLRREARARGVAGDRIVFAPRMSMPLHLARHRLADLFLDTFHFNAHTTASIALWAGLPVLTCPGESFISRIGASLATAIGLPELIAASPAEYEAIAYDLATHPDRLRAIRQKLAAHRMTHPLFDTPRFTAHLEDAYTRMWRRCQDGLPAEHLQIRPQHDPGPA